MQRGARHEALERQLGQRRAHPGALRLRPARRRRAAPTFSDNVNPHLAWSELPAGTRSLALICHDFDVPSRGDDVNQAGREDPGRPAARRLLPLAAGRPAGHRARDRRGRVQPRLHAARQAGPGGRAAGLRRRAPGPQRLHRLVRRRPGAGRRLLRLRRPVPAVERLAGPPLRVHALRAAVARAPVEGAFTGAELRQAIDGHVLAEATALRHLHAQPPPARLVSRSDRARPSRTRRRGSSPSATARRRGTPRCACRASSTPPSASAAAGRRRAPPRRSPAKASRRSSPATWRAPSTPRRRSPRSSACRSRPTPACASAASASSRATPTPRSTRAGPPRRRAGAATTRRSRPRRREPIEFSARAVAAVTRIAARRARPHDRSSSATAACSTACTAPPRASTWRAALVGARQRRDQPAALHRRALHPGRLERHRAPRRRPARRRQRRRLPDRAAGGDVRPIDTPGWS